MSSSTDPLRTPALIIIALDFLVVVGAICLAPKTHAASKFREQLTSSWIEDYEGNYGKLENNLYETNELQLDPGLAPMLEETPPEVTHDSLDGGAALEVHKEILAEKAAKEESANARISARGSLQVGAIQKYFSYATSSISENGGYITISLFSDREGPSLGTIVLEFDILRKSCDVLSLRSYSASFDSIKWSRNLVREEAPSDLRINCTRSEGGPISFHLKEKRNSSQGELLISVSLEDFLKSAH